MKIVNNVNKPNVKKMAEIMIGEVFRFYNNIDFCAEEIFMKTDEHSYVELNDGTLYDENDDWYDGDENVIVLDVELVIKGEK